MPCFGVTAKKAAALAARMRACGVDERDLEERFIRGGGPGGQKINRTASCVYLKHLPSGLEVKTQEARSQALNRFYARRRLCDLLEEGNPAVKSPAQRKAEKIRKQKRRRARRSASTAGQNEACCEKED